MLALTVVGSAALSPISSWIAGRVDGSITAEAAVLELIFTEAYCSESKGAVKALFLLREENS